MGILCFESRSFRFCTKEQHRFPTVRTIAAALPTGILSTRDPWEEVKLSLRILFCSLRVGSDMYPHGFSTNPLSYSLQTTNRNPKIIGVHDCCSPTSDCIFHFRKTPKGVPTMTDLPAALNSLPPRSVRTRAPGNIACLMLLLGLVDATAGGPFAFAQNIQFMLSAVSSLVPQGGTCNRYFKPQKIRHGAAYLLHQRQPILDLVESTPTAARRRFLPKPMC